jgi:hypothetical protein
MGDFFHNAFQNRYLGSFLILENWVRFVKSHSVGRVSLGKMGQEPSAQGTRAQGKG